LAPASSSAAPAAPPASAAPQSTLAEENQWFKQAAEASRNGDVNGALGRLEQLLREHPQSPLAQTAMVRKFRLLAKAGRNAEARHEAERYLSAYPTGFAVSEAQALQRGTEAAPSAVEHPDP
jgi:outer membrane protein assembly factor BamD (BamD/ComL family)